MKKLKLVMIGNGMAGVRTLEELLKLSNELYDITVFGAEPHTNYNRILLSPVLAGEQTFEEIVLNDLDWYLDNNVKLLLNRKEIDGLIGDLKQGGNALVPLSLYFLGGKVKVALGLGKGRKAHDKRQVLAERDAAKEIRNAMGREAKGRARSRRTRP